MSLFRTILLYYCIMYYVMANISYVEELDNAVNIRATVKMSLYNIRERWGIVVCKIHEQSSARSHVYYIG